jgi:hypothetical protein
MVIRSFWSLSNRMTGDVFGHGGCWGGVGVPGLLALGRIQL